MKGLNKVILLGNLTNDPEIKTFLTNGSVIATIVIATNFSYKDKTTDEYKKDAEFHRVILYGQLGKIAQKYIKKGTRVFIEGHLETRKYQNSNGETRYSTEIIAKYMQIISHPYEEPDVESDNIFRGLE